MARIRNLRPAPLGMAIALWNVWSRLTPKQRKQLLHAVRTHGPKAAAKLIELRRRRT